MVAFIPLVVTIMRYFKFHNIGLVNLLFACNSDGAKVSTLREMSKFGFLTSFSPKTIQEEYDFPIGAALDLECHKNNRILEKMSEKKMFGLNREWLLLESVNETSEFKGTSIQIGDGFPYILPGSRVSLVQYTKEDVAFYDMYRVAEWTPMKYLLLARGPHGRVEVPLRRERNDFDGETLRMGTMIDKQKYFYGFDVFKNIEADFYAKATIHVARNIADHLNFSITTLLEDGYGYDDGTGNYSGMVGRVQRHEVDYSTALIMRQDRVKIVDFTGDVQHMRSPLIFKQPKLSAVTNIYTLPLGKDVWLSGSLSCVLFGIMLYISYKVGNKFFNLSSQYDVSLGETITTVISCLTQQGPPSINVAPRGRITLFLFECTIFLLFVAYSAKIVALLRSSVEKVKTLSDLTNGQWEVGVQDIIYNKVFFVESEDPDIIKFYKKKIEPQGEKAYSEPDVGLKKITTGMFAYKVETEWAYRLIEDTFDEKDKCGLSEIDLFMEPVLAIPVIKKSGLREHLTRSVARQTEVGLVYQANNPTGKKGKISCDPSGIYSSVDLTDFSPPLLIMGIGTLISAVIFFFEIYIFRCDFLKKNKPVIERFRRDTEVFLE